MTNLFCLFQFLGEGIVAFATLTESSTEEEDELVKALRMLVRSEIGPFAAPDVVCITPSLPMVSLVYRPRVDTVLTGYTFRLTFRLIYTVLSYILVI